MKSRPFRHLAHVAPLADEPLVFLTVTTYDRTPILAHGEAHEALRTTWIRSAVCNGWWVGHYVIMPDHVHVFARGGRSADRLADWVKAWKSVSSRRIAKMLSLQPPVWQEDYFDRYLRSSENYAEKWRYVEENPVRAGLVARAVDWAYRGVIHELRW